MEMTETKKCSYFIATRSEKRKGLVRGSVGRIEAETETGDLIGPIFRDGGNVAKSSGTVKRENSYLLSVHQARLLLLVSPASRRLELLCNTALFSAICGLAQDDLVVVRYKMGLKLCLVKNLVRVGQGDGPGRLQMLGFQLEPVNPEQQKVSKKPNSLPLFNASDIVQVAPGFNVKTRKPLRDSFTADLNMSDVFSAPLIRSQSVKSGKTIFLGALSTRPWLDVDSMVEIVYGGRLVHGVIRWIGIPDGKKNCWAGLELENNVTTSDGILGKKRYFSCQGNRALFVPLDQCSPDARFLSTPPPDELCTPPETPPLTPVEDLDKCVSPVDECEAVCVLVGRMKGIQGHLNSCYLDTSLFSLFCSSTTLDGALNNTESEICCTLRIDIVNPLRRCGFVPAENVMNFRKQLGCSSFVTEEKDPEEFISILMEQVLHMEPLIKIRCKGELRQLAYTHQIIVEKNQMHATPTVQQLLEMSFMSNELKFEEIPSCLLVQMPRFGKKFKMFPRIIPSTTLDITDLLHGAPRECFICGQIAVYECSQCTNDSKLQPCSIKQYCSTCSTQVHTHPCRKTHSPCSIPGAELFATDRPVPRHRMQLFAVLCINTSHYVSFVKYGPGPKTWLFFDSMADRCGDGGSGYNVPVVRECPEVGDFLSQSEQQQQSGASESRGGELLQRLLSDSYMCLYHNTDTLEKSEPQT